MSATDLQRYKKLPRLELIEKIQRATRGTTAHFTVNQLHRMHVDELAALLIEVEGR